MQWFSSQRESELKWGSNECWQQPWGGWCDAVAGPVINEIDPEKYSRGSARACPADRVWIEVSGDGDRIAPPAPATGTASTKLIAKSSVAFPIERAIFWLRFAAAMCPIPGQYWSRHYLMSLIGKHLVLREPHVR